MGCVFEELGSKAGEAREKLKETGTNNCKDADLAGFILEQMGQTDELIFMCQNCTIVATLLQSGKILTVGSCDKGKKPKKISGIF